MSVNEITKLEISVLAF